MSFQGQWNQSEVGGLYTPIDQASAIATTPTAADYNALLAILRTNGLVAE